MLNFKATRSGGKWLNLYLQKKLISDLPWDGNGGGGHEGGGLRSSKDCGREKRWVGRELSLIFLCLPTGAGGGDLLCLGSPKPRNN